MLGFAMQENSSLTLRMTLTQCFKNLNCHYEAKLKNLKPQHLEKNRFTKKHQNAGYGNKSVACLNLYYSMRIF